MDMKFDIYQVKEEFKECFVPKKGHLTPFEKWAMIKAYCSLYDLLGPNCVSDRKLQDTCVWNGNDLYNVEHQISKDGGSSRLWLTGNGILMLEVYYDDGRPDKLYRCD